MATVCFVTALDGAPGADMLSYETVRQALSPYDLAEPYANAIEVETVSLGAAVALLDDLSWYLTRTVADVAIRDPSIHAEEYLSRELATAIREEALDPGETGSLVKIYGVDDGRLVEPMYAERRRDGSLPEYDLRSVSSTLVVRVSEAGFGT